VEKGKRILVIDDDTTLLNLLSQTLERRGYQAVTAANGLEGLQKLYEKQPGLVILDVMMPRMDGWETCARIRQISRVPIIMLTAKDEQTDKLKGFELGIDDYVTKPFSSAELVARVEAVLRRSQASSPAPKSRIHMVGELIVDTEAHRVTLKSEPLELTPLEFRLLVHLVENRGRLLTHEQLLHHVWGPEYEDQRGYVKRYIWYLRQKLEKDPSNPEYILTERGFGYTFRKD
jgi:two-component system KDP operon response regulator KdpE